MSIEKAREFVKQAIAGDEAVTPLLAKDITLDTVEFATAEDYARTAQNAQKAGWDISAEDLHNACRELLELNESELDAVVGGGSCWGDKCDKADGLSEGHGGCKTNFYKEACRATVEKGSGCNCTDYNPRKYHEN